MQSEASLGRWRATCSVLQGLEWAVAGLLVVQIVYPVF
jgi:hypothetical protein